MSIEHYCELGIGFQIKEDKIPAKYVQRSPEDGDIFAFNGVRYEEFLEFLDAVAVEVGGRVKDFGNQMGSETYYWISIPLPSENKKNFVSADWLFRNRLKLDRIGKKLKALGFRVKPAQIAVLETVS